MTGPADWKARFDAILDQVISRDERQLRDSAIQPYNAVYRSMMLRTAQELNITNRDLFDRYFATHQGVMVWAVKPPPAHLGLDEPSYRQLHELRRWSVYGYGIPAPRSQQLVQAAEISVEMVEIINDAPSQMYATFPLKKRKKSKKK